MVPPRYPNNNKRYSSQSSKSRPRTAQQLLVSAFFSNKKSTTSKSNESASVTSSVKRSLESSTKSDQTAAALSQSINSEKSTYLLQNPERNLNEGIDNSNFLENEEESHSSKRQKIHEESTIEKIKVVEKPPAQNIPHPPKTLTSHDRSKLQLLSSQRHDKYSYKFPSPSQTNGDTNKDQASDELNDLILTEKQLHEKEQRRKAFYERLRTPGAIEQIKRRTPQTLLVKEDLSTSIDGSSHGDENDDTPADGNTNENDSGENEDGSNSSSISNLATKFSNTKKSRSSTKKTASTVLSTNNGHSYKSKLTPMNQQYVDLKRQHPDTILLIETGYKYQLFGNDARTVSRALHIFFKDGKMTLDETDPRDAKYPQYAYTTFLATQLNLNIQRLVNLGYKVGVVQQMETAAVKAQGKNKSAPFERKLTRVYTKGTMVDNFDMEFSGSKLAGNNQKVGYLLALTEGKFGSQKQKKNNSSGSKTTESKIQRIGMMAVQTTTGEIMYDEFDDNSVMHTELETRLLHLQPAEILIVGEISPTTKKLLRQLSGSKALSSDPRIEYTENMTNIEASNFVYNYYNKLAKKINGDSNNSGGQKDNDDILGQKLDLLDSFPDTVKVCLSALIKYLKEFGLDIVFDLTNNFSPFSSQSHMQLNGNTIMSLELFQNLTDYKRTGSLFACLDYTRTTFGQRRLQKWVARPLIDRKAIEARLEAVDQLKSNYTAQMGTLMSILASVSDLERILISIYYKRCTRQQLYYFLLHIRRVSEVIFQNTSAFDNFESKLLTNIFETIPRVYGFTTTFLTEISEEDAKKNSKTDFFKDADDRYEDIADTRASIYMVEDGLKQHLAEQKRAIRVASLEYVSLNGAPYFIKVLRKDAAKVPDTWIKHSQVATAGRYRSPEVTELVKQLNYLQETFEMECEKAYQLFLERINVHYEQYRAAIQSLAELDCYLSLAAVAAQKHYVRPEFVDYSCCQISQGRHPMVEQNDLVRGNYTYVANDTEMALDHNRAMIITGPNMGGKSSYVRQIALICIMAQIGCYVPASFARLGIVDAVYTRMGAYDNIMASESTFQVELKECSDILRHATSRSLVILDEIGRGTGTMDGVAIAHAVLETFIRDIQALTLFVTHYPSLTLLEDKYPGGIVGNYHMGYLERPNEKYSGESEVVFLYTLVKGVAHNSYGYVFFFFFLALCVFILFYLSKILTCYFFSSYFRLNVARLAEIPESVIARAREMALELKEQISVRQDISFSKDMCRVIELALNQSKSTKDQQHKDNTSHDENNDDDDDHDDENNDYEYDFINDDLPVETRKSLYRLLSNFEIQRRAALP